MVVLKGIHKTYFSGKNSLHVLKGIDLHIKKGELVAIMGSSGSGKSTLLNIIGILDNYDQGEYELAGTLVKNLSETKAAFYRNKFLGFIFQSFNLLSFKNAIENVALPLYYQGTARTKRNEIALQYLEKVGLLPWAHHLPSQLSGGQKQRVAIARALASNPQLILADEPTGALDSKTSVEIMQLIQEINDQGITVIIVTHEKEIADMCSRRILLKDGLIVEDVQQQRVNAFIQH